MAKRQSRNSPDGKHEYIIISGGGYHPNPQAIEIAREDSLFENRGNEKQKKKTLTPSNPSSIPINSFQLSPDDFSKRHG